MKRLRVLLCAVLCFAPGCAADGTKGQWDEFWKDLRGDNMKMHSSFPGTQDVDRQPRPPHSND